MLFKKEDVVQTIATIGNAMVLIDWLVHKFRT
jgi:hypothetical protein